MQRKHKMTGCARLFLVLLILAPLAYLGAAYYNGQDGIQNVKNLLGIGKHSEEMTNDTYNDAGSDLQDIISTKDKEILQLREEITELKKQNKTLKDELDALSKKEEPTQ